MIKVSVKLDKRHRLKNGKYPLKFRVSRNNKAFYILTGIELREEEWDSKNERVKLLPDRRLIDKKIARLSMRVDNVISELQQTGKLRYTSDKKLISLLSSDSTDEAKQRLFSVQLQSFIATKDNTRTKDLYLATEKKMQACCDYENLYLEDIDIEWLDDFVSNLKNTGCTSPNSRAIHLRNIRSILNYSKKHDLLKEYVFDSYKIEQKETVKRSLSVEDLRKLHNAELGKTQQMYRDIFFLIFYLIGINLVDLSRIVAVKNGRIEYTRAKTGTFYDIKVEPEAEDIIQRYRGDKHLLSIFDRYKDYNGFKRHLTQNLHSICDEIGMPRVSSYWARHTWATIAYNIGIQMDVISDCLGHKSMQNKITQIYVNKDVKRIDKANRQVIDYVLYNRM